MPSKCSAARHRPRRAAFALHPTIQKNYAKSSDILICFRAPESYKSVTILLQKNFFIFFEKVLDKCEIVCYNVDRKREELNLRRYSQ